MNVKELAEGIKSGTIKFNSNGHDIRSHDRSSCESFLFFLNAKIEHWEEQMLIPNKDTLDMQDYYRRHLTNQVPIEYPLYEMYSDRNCWNCGARLVAVLKSETELLMANMIHFRAKEPSIIDSNDCMFSKGANPTSNTININSTLYFVNHFGGYPETPDDAEHDDGYSINYHIGRVNIAKFLAFKNIGYGQVGNTSISIYLHKDKKKIRIVEGYTVSLIGEAEYVVNDPSSTPQEVSKAQSDIEILSKVLLDYEYVEEISLGVWRWMCADKSTILKNDLNLNNEGTLTDRATIPEKHRYNNDVVACEVVPGEWRITHYHRTDKHLFDRMTVATLELIEEK